MLLLLLCDSSSIGYVFVVGMVLLVVWFILNSGVCGGLI